MSGRCTGWVLKHGPQDRAMRAVLLVVADDADKDGINGHPGLDAIIRESLYGRSHVLATLDRLAVDGWLEVTAKRSPGRATVYRVCMDRAEVHVGGPVEVQSPDVPDAARGPIEPEPEVQKDHQSEVQTTTAVERFRGPLSVGQRSNIDESEVQSASSHTSSCIPQRCTSTVSTTRANPESFDEFWSVYPRHVAKGAAHKAWTTATKKTEPGCIIDAAAVFAQRSLSTEPRFVPHPATWLNAERWLDEPDRPPEPAGFGALRRLAGSDR